MNVAFSQNRKMGGGAMLINLIISTKNKVVIGKWRKPVL